MTPAEIQAALERARATGTPMPGEQLGQHVGRLAADIEALAAEVARLQGRLDTSLTEQRRQLCAETDEVIAERDQLRERLATAVAALEEVIDHMPDEDEDGRCCASCISAEIARPALAAIRGQK